MKASLQEEKTLSGCEEQMLKPEEGEREESELEKMLFEMGRFICDDLCKYRLTEKGQDAIDTICLGCDLSTYICEITNKCSFCKANK